MPGSWLVSAHVTEGVRCARDEFGEDLLIRLPLLVNASAHQASRKTSGDGWNGAFHIKARGCTLIEAGYIIMQGETATCDMVGPALCF